ncbi:unnamed protein product [Closterium sp. Naga37s-1]|nr:unnamed protein product [Closterium sp. Naga37s-1]
MSYLLPHLHSGWAVDQAILSEEDRVVVIRFGHDWDDVCMQVSDVSMQVRWRVHAVGTACVEGRKEHMGWGQSVQQVSCGRPEVGKILQVLTIPVFPFLLPPSTVHVPPFPISFKTPPPFHLHFSARSHFPPPHSSPSVLTPFNLPSLHLARPSPISPLFFSPPFSHKRCWILTPCKSSITCSLHCHMDEVLAGVAETIKNLAVVYLVDISEMDEVLAGVAETIKNFAVVYLVDISEMDEVLAGVAETIKNFAVVYLVDISEVPDFNTMYELYDPCTHCLLLSLCSTLHPRFPIRWTRCWQEWQRP